MADVPTNEKLYALVVMQAKAKYRIYPSPGASHWVHRRYLELGGKFQDSAEKAEHDKMVRRFIEIRQDRMSHGDHDAKEKKSSTKKHGDK
jgi:hypothetical protein